MKTEYEKCMAGEPFIGSRDPKIVEMILRTKRLLAQFNATDYADSKRRRELLCEMLGHVGKNVHVDIDFHCECGKHIFMGDKVIVNMNCTFVDNNRIDIGSNVLIASNVQIYTATHSTKVDERMVQDCPEEQEICRKMHRKNGDSLKHIVFGMLMWKNRYGRDWLNFLFRKGSRKFTVWIRESMTVELWWIVIL